MDRRTLIAAGIGTGIAATLADPVAAGPAAPAEQLRLWPGRPPGGEGVTVTDTFVLRNPGGSADDIAWTHLANPYLKLCPAPRPNGAAVLLIPGGGYTRIAVGRAPSDIARMYASRGVSAFELLYRLPHDGWAAGPDAPLQDAQRAMRLIRHHAPRWRIDPARLMAIGFSAGGHLAGRLGGQAATPTYAPVDAADAQSARPIALGMFFPVVTMVGPDVHLPSKRELLGADQSDARAVRWSLDRTIPADMPPTFVCHNADDASVKYTNSLAMFAALQAAHIPSELMIGERGGHGPRLIDADGTPHVWFQVLQAFAARHGWLA